MKEKQAVTRQIRSRCLQAGRKEKSAILGEFIKITCYKNRKYALRILNKPQAPQALLIGNGKASKLKPPKKRIANHAGKKIYTDGVVLIAKLVPISPAAIDRALKKDKTALALKGKSLTKPGRFLKHRIPIRTFYSSVERKLPGFTQIDTGGL